MFSKDMPTSAAAIYFLFGCVFYYIYEGNIVCESARAKNESRSRHRTLSATSSHTRALLLVLSLSLPEQISRRPLHASQLFSNIYALVPILRAISEFPLFVKLRLDRCILLFKSADIDSDFDAHTLGARLARHLRECSLENRMK